MAKNDNLQDFIQDLGDTIRRKKGTSAKINPQNFSSEIESIQTGSDPVLQSKSVTPSTSQQKVQPDAGYDGLSDVTVTAVTSSIDDNISAGNIKSGVSILGVTGTLQEGIIPEGTLEITENDTYDVTTYASVEVNVESGPSGEYNIEQVTLDDGTCELKITEAAGGSESLDGSEIGLINIDLEKYPDFPAATTSYPIKISKEEFLISTVVSGSGLWLYNSKTGEPVKVCSDGYAWKNHYICSNGNVLLTTGSSTAGVLLYDKKLKTATLLASLGNYIDTFNEQPNGDVFMSSWNNNGTNGLLWYSKEQQTVIKIPSSRGGYCGGAVLPNGDVIFGGGQFAGIYVYSKNTGTSTVIDSTIRGSYFMPLENGDFLIGRYNTTGLYHYSFTNNTITTVTESGTDWKTAYKLPDGKYLVGGSNSSSGLGGIRLYNPVDNSFTATKQTSYAYDKFIGLPDNTILCVGTSSAAGLYVYDYANNDVVKNFGYVSVPQAKQGLLIPYDNGDLFIWGYGTNGYGTISYFSFENMTTTSLKSVGTHMSNYNVTKLSNGNVEVTGGAGLIDYLFDYETKTLKATRWSTLK